MKTRLETEKLPPFVEAENNGLGYSITFEISQVEAVLAWAETLVLELRGWMQR